MGIIVISKRAISTKNIIVCEPIIGIDGKNLGAHIAECIISKWSIQTI